MNEPVALTDCPITHAHLRAFEHPVYGSDFKMRSAVRYMRFMRVVSVDSLHLPRHVYGSWIPSVPTHPAHITISTLNRNTLRWEPVKELELPPDPRTSGVGLSQQMSIEDVEAHFSSILQDPPLIIELGGIQTDHLRIECDRVHAVWPNHGECNGGEYNVPFGVLNPIVAYGTNIGELCIMPYNPILSRDKIEPAPGQGMRVLHRPDMLVWESDRMSIGFSLTRPMIKHMGWDIAGARAHENRLLASAIRAIPPTIAGCSGPLLRGLDFDFGCQQWTGHVSVKGNTIAYTDLRASDSLRIDASFTVEPESVRLEIVQHCDKQMPVLESEPWRFAWNLKSGITGAAGVPTSRSGRSGDVALPVMLATDGVGCLAVNLRDGDSERVGFQVESYRGISCVTGGFCASEPGDNNKCSSISPGTTSFTAEISLDNFEPEADQRSVPEMIRQYWSTPFSCFRSEYRGFSNHSASTNCHLSQCVPIETVAYTAKPANGPDPLELAKFTLKTALLGGGGYGYYRNLYMDSDLMLVCAAGRVFGVGIDMPWLQSIKPGLSEAVDRILGTLSEEGLAVCRDLSGNTGSYRWSTNSMDVIGSGHLDAYVNAWTYRALRNAQALNSALGDAEISGICDRAASKLQAAFASEFINPETGWVAGWRSRDGALHDYAFIWVNGAAIAFGLLEPVAARIALENLENLRDKVGPYDACMGLPLNLLPIKPEDHMLPKIVGGVAPTFETYTDGSLSGWPVIYYLRALSIYGLKERASKLTQDLQQGLKAGIFTGADGTGHEFRSWEGLPTGYEGTLIGCVGFLYSIAVEEGVLQVSDPEWWPELNQI